MQKIPAIQSLTRRPGKRMKELAVRMEKLPSSLITHKRVDTLDTRLAEMEGDLVSNPLEQNLGFFEFGKHATAPDDADHTFEKINDSWNEEMQSELNLEDKDKAESLEGRDGEREESNDKEIDPQERSPTKKRRQRDEEVKTTAKRAKSNEDDMTPPSLIASFLKEPWKDVQDSANKLFIIQRLDERNRQAPASWHVVQVDAEGECHVRCHARNALDSRKRLVRNCRCWPLTREIKQPSGEFGDIVMPRPNKVDEVLAKRQHSQGWHQGKVNLAEQAIIGPFNFSIDQNEQSCIHLDVW
jgi:hypothetical protein